VRALATPVPGVLLIELDVRRDPRGFFVETYHAEKFCALGITDRFVQDNHSRSVRGTIRGLHLQVGRLQAKLIRVVEGEIFDVAVDVRRGSPTFGRWTGSTLSAERFTLCYVPAGFAHGFAVTSDVAQVEYKCSEVYDPRSEIGIAWDDPAIGIGWPLTDPILSAKDQANPRLAELSDDLPTY
jgi:dTDP-4-dehydrorhamnose 3,5-epimerase